MFAYCRNNPVRRVDTSGKLDFECEIENEINDLDEDKLTNWSNGGKTQASSVTTNTKTPIGPHPGRDGRGTYRNNLQNFTGFDGEGYDAHHIYPYSMAEDFWQIGIDVNKPQYGAWWESNNHRQNSYEYNLWWKAFFSISGVTAGDACALAEFLAELFGFTRG